MGNGASRSPGHSSHADARSRPPLGQPSSPGGTDGAGEQPQPLRPTSGNAPAPHTGTSSANTSSTPTSNVQRVSTLTDELLKTKAKLQLAQQKLRDVDAPGIPHTECIVCMDAAVDTVFIPCGHICLCNGCCTSLQKGASGCFKCPLCRLTVEKSQRIYLPVHRPPPARHTQPGNKGGVTGSTRITLSARPRLPRGDSASNLLSPRLAWPEPEHSDMFDSPNSLLSKTLPAGFEFPVRHDVVRPAQ